MTSHEDSMSLTDTFITGEAVCTGSRLLPPTHSSATCPHQSALSRISFGCFVLISHFLDSFIFPFGPMLSLEAWCTKFAHLGGGVP